MITRPLVSVEDEEIGFLPGNLVSKMDPWTRPILDIFTEFYSMSDVTNFLKCGVLEIAPLAFMRGRTFHNTFVLADEMQNSSPSQMMMLTTRMGKDSKLVLTGDLAQSDRVVKGTGSYATSNGLQDFFDKLENHRKYVGDEYALRDIGLISMNTQDVKRSTLVSHILEIYGERSEPIYTDPLLMDFSDFYPYDRFHKDSSMDIDMDMDMDMDTAVSYTHLTLPTTPYV